MERIYLDNAASTPLLPEVREAMLPYLTQFFGNPSSIHQQGRQLRSAIEAARKTVADGIGCSPAEIVFTSGGTEADNMAIKGAVMGLGVTHIITSPIEHHAVGHCVDQLAEHNGIRVSYLTPNERGELDTDELEKLLHASKTWKEKTLVSLMHGNNEVGTLNNIQAIGALCKQYGAFFHSDTVQTMGHLPLSVAEVEADFLVASAHKFHGPCGVGFLYVRGGTAVPSLICGGGQERGQRAGTENVAAIVGLQTAFQHALANLDNNLAHLRAVKAYAMQQLSAAVPGLQFNGVTDLEQSLPTVLNVAFPSEDCESLLLFNLDLHGVSASGGSACTSGANNPSHVLSGMGLPEPRIANSVRFSFGTQTTKADIDGLLERLGRFMPQVKAAVV